MWSNYTTVRQYCAPLLTIYGMELILLRVIAFCFFEVFKVSIFVSLFSFDSITIYVDFVILDVGV